MKLKTIVASVTLLLGAQLVLAQKVETKLPTAKTVEASDQAPDFSLKGQDGKTYSLKDYKGKIVVLEWFNNDCPYVKKHYDSSNMQEIQKKYTGKGVVWFSVSSTKAENAIKAEELSKIYADRKSKATAILMDTDGSVARAYSAKTTPHLFIINADGKIAYTGAIDDNDSFSKDVIKTSKNFVAEALDVLLGKDKTKIIASPQTKPYGCSIKI